MALLDQPELVNAAEIGRRLNLSSERVRQLAKSAQLPAARGRVGRNLVWGWPDIEAWAVAVGRLEAPQGGAIRRAPRIWLPTSPPEMRKGTDEVLTWGPHGARAHVRIWQPADGSPLPVVVLLGNLEDERGRSVTNSIELVAAAVAERWLGKRAYDADWFEYWPPTALDVDEEFCAISFAVEAGRRGQGLRASRPQFSKPAWHQVTRGQLEALLGEQIDAYLDGTYLAGTVMAVAEAAGSPVDVILDPDGLSQDLDALALVVAELSGITEQPSPFLALAARALGSRANEKLAKALEEVEGQSWGATTRKVSPHVSPAARALLRKYGPIHLTDIYDDPQLPPRLLLELRQWLFDEDPASREELLPGPRGWAWPDEWQTAGSLVEEGGNVPAMVRALRLAEHYVSQDLWEQYEDFASEDHPSAYPSVVSLRGTLARAYIDTVAWWGPRPEDDNRASRLSRLLEDQDARFGYDPWGRLVLAAKSGRQFATEWPAVLPNPPPNDAARIRADPRKADPAPVFIELGDGRLDLLPITPGDAVGAEFTWGYVGAGPRAFADALVYLCTGHHALRSDRAAHAVTSRSRALERFLIANKRGIDIPVSEVRGLLASSNAEEIQE